MANISSGAQVIHSLQPVLGKRHPNTSVEHSQTVRRKVTDACLRKNASWHFVACEKRVPIPMSYTFHSPQSRVWFHGIGPPDNLEQWRVRGFRDKLQCAWHVS